MHAFIHTHTDIHRNTQIHSYTQTHIYICKDKCHTRVHMFVNVTYTQWRLLNEKEGYMPIVIFRSVKRSRKEEEGGGAYMAPYISIRNPTRRIGNVLNAEI